MSNNIKKGLVILSLLLVTASGFASYKVIPVYPVAPAKPAAPVAPEKSAAKTIALVQASMKRTDAARTIALKREMKQQARTKEIALLRRNGSAKSERAA